jgi:dynactin-4
MSDVSPHPDQTRAGTAIHAVQDQINTTIYLPLTGISSPFFNNHTTPAYASERSIRSGTIWEEDKKFAVNNPVIVGGRSYSFVLSFMNPTYDSIQVRLNVSRSPLPTATMTAPTDESDSAPQQEKRRSSFLITLLTFTPSVVAFAEAWEYDEDEDNMVENNHADLAGDRRHAFHLEHECTRLR